MHINFIKKFIKLNHNKLMSSLAKNYNRRKIAFKKGKGSFLYATNGKKYLDFVQGIAVNSLGHSNSFLVNFLANFSPSGIIKAFDTCHNFFACLLTALIK